MFKSGLASVTFRSLKPKEIVTLAKRAELSAVEWGGDVHVPHGDIVKAKEVRKMTMDAGIELSSYGSYYVCGKPYDTELKFKDVLNSAISLQVKTIRVWAGKMSSFLADDNYTISIINDTKRIAEMASSEGIEVAFEYHANTLTDSIISTEFLLKEISHPNVYSYWQPSSHYEEKDMKSSIKSILPYLSNIHVFHWVNRQRHTLYEGREKWKRYFKEISKSNRDIYFLLEFVKNNSTEQMIDDARVLKELIGITTNLQS